MLFANLSSQTKILEFFFLFLEPNLEWTQKSFAYSK
jgi:hypothetical protein